MRHRSCAACAALISIICASLGRAEPTKRDADAGARANVPVSPEGTRPNTAAADARGYMYQFTDDPLAAGGFDAHDARIVVASHRVRATLIRPRTAFVVEMLKSVENL